MQQTVRAFSFMTLMALVGAAHAAQEDPQKVIQAYMAAWNAHDAEKAHNSLVEYYNVIKDLTTEDLYY